MDRVSQTKIAVANASTNRNQAVEPIHRKSDDEQQTDSVVVYYVGAVRERCAKQEPSWGQLNCAFQGTVELSASISIDAVLPFLPLEAIVVSQARKTWLVPSMSKNAANGITVVDATS